EILRVSRSLRELVQRIIQWPEWQRIGERTLLRPHRDDVTEDAADPGVGPSVLLDRGRMVVALDAQGIRVVLVEFHDTGIAAVDHVRRLDREDELLEDDLRGLVAAVLGPRLAEALQFDVRRISPNPPEVLLDAAHFIDGEREHHTLAELRELWRGGVAQDYIVLRVETE